jgi:hypothetical protein
VAPDGYLRGVLADGSRPVRFRAGIRELLGASDDNGVRVSFPPRPPRGGFRYVQQHGAAPRVAEWEDGSYWLAETDNFELAPAPVRMDVSDATGRPSDHLKRNIEPPATAKRVALVPSPTAATAEELVPPADAGAVELPPTAARPALSAMRTKSQEAQGISAPTAGPSRPTSNLIQPAERSGPIGLADRQDPPAARLERAVVATTATPVDPPRPAALPGPERLTETPQRAAASGRPSAAPRPIRTLRVAAPAVRPERETDRGPGAVESVVASNRPPHRRAPKPDVTIVATPPVVERPSAPPPAPPRIVVVHAPAEAAADPAFWERRQLGRLTNRIVR